METISSKHIRKKRILSVIIISLFFLWGIANDMTDTLLYAFKQLLKMTGEETYFIKFAFYVAYFCISLPAFFFIKKHAYKNGIILGLMLYAGGAILFFPAASFMSYAFYLTAIYVMAAGCAFLETVANPYILSMEHNINDGIRKLNLAQSFNPAGAILGILICNFLVLDTLDAKTSITENMEIVKEELDTITIIYAALGQILLVFMMVLLFINVPSFESDTTHDTSFFKSLKRLFNDRIFSVGLLTMFVYLGAQVGVWTFTTTTIEEVLGKTHEQSANLYIIAMAFFMGGRFIFTFLMKYYRPQILLLVSAVGAFVCTITVMFSSGYVLLTALIGISFLMSLMFATIFGCSMHNVRADRQLGGALMIMSIVGGAVITTVQDTVYQKLDVQSSFIIPALCFLIVIFFAVLLIPQKTQ
ncbi:MAG: L-fucose:H+ symporter permease [Bacteroidales bacterium]|nr:L-fucose:H+ symporter permease [Bacteroidales bacterium]